MLVNYWREDNENKESHQLIKFSELMLKQTYNNPALTSFKSIEPTN